MSSRIPTTKDRKVLVQLHPMVRNKNARSDRDGSRVTRSGGWEESDLGMLHLPIGLKGNKPKFYDGKHSRSKKVLPNESKSGEAVDG